MNNTLHDSQHGFRQGRSCESALLQSTKMLFTLRSKKQYTYIAALDFLRVFDTVNIEVLYEQFCLIADSCTALWFKSYLTDHRRATKYCNSISDVLDLSSGVPQGSVLGPTLFTFYINGLQNKIGSTTKGAAIAFAADVTIVGFSNIPQEAAASIQHIILNVCDWSAMNGLILNPSKCQAMFINPFKRKTATAATSCLTLGDTENCIQLVTELRLLGVTFSVDLSWSVQSSKVRTSISRMIGVINRFGTSVNCITCRCVLTAFVLPKLTYCLPV